MPAKLQKYNTDFLKLVGMLTILVDHIGKILVTDLLCLQIIGRIAYPLFCYCLAVGYLRTSNFKRYLGRLLIFGLVSQPVYILAFGFPWFRLNIFFGLAYGLLAIHGLARKQYFWVVGLLVVSAFLPIPYDIYGVGLTLLFYLVLGQGGQFWLAALVGYLLAGFWQSGATKIFGLQLDIQGFAVLSLPLIAWQRLFKIRLPRQIFYWFYPVHLCFLYLLAFVWN